MVKGHIILTETLRQPRPVSHHFSCFPDGLVLIAMSVSGGLLLLNLIHDGVDGEAEARHAWQVTDGDVKLQRVLLPRVV